MVETFFSTAMIMVRYYWMVFFVTLLSCSGDDNSVPIDSIEDCVTGTLFGKMIWNDECWVAEKKRFIKVFSDPADKNFYIELERELDGYEEKFVFNIPAGIAIEQKIYFSPSDNSFEKSEPIYFYAQGDG